MGLELYLVFFFFPFWQVNFSTSQMPHLMTLKTAKCSVTSCREPLEGSQFCAVWLSPEFGLGSGVAVRLCRMQYEGESKEAQSGGMRSNRRWDSPCHPAFL